jgi:hypothetical protein
VLVGFSSHVSLDVAVRCEMSSALKLQTVS